MAMFAQLSHHTAAVLDVHEKQLFSRQSSATSTNDNTGGGGGTTPLLFFIALGFGVVFTNLSIIVGVKYCFRYNARNRQLLAAAEAGEAGDAVAMEQTPRPRRRREKKLMSMDEVNEKFPMIKYKAWILQKSTTNTSDDDASESRSLEPSGKHKTPVHAEHRISGDYKLQTSAVDATMTTPTTTSPDTADKTPAVTDSEAEKNDLPTSVATSEPTNPQLPAVPPPVARREGDFTENPATNHHHSDSKDADTDSDDDHMAGGSVMNDDNGDACAICIDTLEDDDDVRGLTCGHAFHASCVDPWLTVRRACCPLCKADYYVPKTRPSQPGAPSNPEQIESFTVTRVNTPRGAWFNLRGSRRNILSAEEEAMRARREQQRVRRAHRRAAEMAAIQQEEQERRAAERLARRREQGLPGEEPTTGMVSSLRQAVSGFRFGRTRNVATTAASPVAVPSSAVIASSPSTTTPNPS